MSIGNVSSVDNSEINGIKRSTAVAQLEDSQSVEENSYNCLENNPESPSRLPRLVSRHNVISRKDNLILSPEVKEMHEVTENDHAGDLGDSDFKEYSVDKILARKQVSAATFQRDFDLSDVLDYIKTGVACIIEDEVTQRFEAEELKSWNLLTRTNDKFMFINWKLTFFWGFGCFFRYCFLLPGRIAILIVGVQ